MEVKSEREVTQSCLTLHDAMDYSLPGSSIHGILQARVLEWGAIAFSVRQPDGYIKKKRTRYNKINSDGLEMLDVKNKLRENNFQV